MTNALPRPPIPPRRKPGWLALLALAPVALAAAAPSPFEGLERTLRDQVKQEREELSSAGMLKEGLERESKLALLYQHLHDIRNHRAFWELWSRWGCSRTDVEILYVGSGAHLAPLVFLHGPNPPKRMTYTYTEVNPFSAMRIEALLARMVRAGLYRDLTVEVAPAPGSPFAGRWARERGEGAGPARSALEFTRWVVAASAAVGTPPSFVARFRFARGATRAEIRLLVRCSDSEPGSASYFNRADLERADLAITHDWDYDPRGNLGVLLAFVEAHSAGPRTKPLAVMMEDLSRYPFPVDLALFNPVAESAAGYGHTEFLTWSDGAKAEEEDGATLYGGGVILRPDTAYLGALSRDARTDLFNLLLFSGEALSRRNVDLFAGTRVLAPALLDLGVGYAGRDVRGEAVRDRPGFLARLAEAAARLPGSTPHLPGPLRPLWCEEVARFERALRAGKTLELGPLVAQAERDLRENPFVRAGGSRAKLERLLLDKPALEALLKNDRKACGDALDALESGRDILRKTCPPPAPGGP